MRGGIVANRLELGVDLRQLGTRLRSKGLQFKVAGDRRQARRQVGFPFLPVGAEHVQAAGKAGYGLGMGAQLFLGWSKLSDLFCEATYLFIRLLEHGLIGAVAVTQLPALLGQGLDQGLALSQAEGLTTQGAGRPLTLRELVDARFEFIHFSFEARVFSPGLSQAL